MRNAKEQNDVKKHIHIPSLVICSAAEGDNPFINFQTNPPAEELETRHYFESIAATMEVNRNLYQFEAEALEMIAEGFKERKILTINHDKGGFSNTLGYGATVDAVVEDGRLYVASYLSLGKTYPNGPFGTAEELRDGIVDGFINSVSQSVYAIKARCSVCDQPYPTTHSAEHYNENSCQHYRGQPVIVEENGEQVFKNVHVIIEEAEAIELSLVGVPADQGSGITKKQMSFALDDFIDEEKFNYLFGGQVNAPSTPNIVSSGLTNGGNSVSTITQAQYDSMKTRAEMAEQESAKLRVESTANQGKESLLKSQNDALEAQKNGLEAQVQALESQVATANADRDRAKKDLEDANKAIEAKNQEVVDLKKSAEENKIAIDDGMAARKEFEEEYVTSFAAAVGDDCTDEMKEAQVEVAKSFSIEILKSKINGFKETAKHNYPSGKLVKKDDGGQDDMGDGRNDEDGYLIGVG